MTANLKPTLIRAVALLGLFLLGITPALADDGQGCLACHDDIAKILPAGHPDADKARDADCLTCHQPGDLEQAQPRPFSALVHRSHAGQLDCDDCHEIDDQKGFGLGGASLGKPSESELKSIHEAFATWADGAYLDHVHAANNVTCAGCHGQALPAAGAEVDNSRCLACHGPMEQLIAKTAPEQFPDRNPHNSHLGEIGCAVCHHAHYESEIYCLGCHGNFDMKLPHSQS